jgi:glycosyltransferase involved in cell wall biosynthesis
MPRRLLLLNTDLEIGGTPTVVRELALRLSSPQVEVEVACLSPLGPIGEQLISAGVPVTPLNARSGFDLTILPRLLTLLERRGIDTVLSFLMHANAIAALAHFWRRPGRWFQSIQTTQPTPHWHWRIQAMAARSAEKIIVPSPSVAQCAREWADVPAEKIVIIPNGLDLEEFLPSPGTPEESEGGEKMPMRIGFIGRLDPVKRIGDLLAATARLGARYRLDVFGEGAERGTIEAQIAALGLNGRVKLHGAISRPHKALAAMDVLVLPSSAEGFGLVLIEAQAAGVPVVATDAPGIRDVIIHGQTGLLVPVGDVAALAEAVRTVREQPAAWRDRIDEARQEVERRYTWSRVIPMYRAVLGLTTASRRP